jgi:hypothetical protein
VHTIRELEAAVDWIGELAWASERQWCLDRLGEMYDGGIDAFGLSGPDDDELRDAHLWFLLDCPQGDGQTPLWRVRQRVPDRAVELLSRSELRAWRIESVESSVELTALCPLGTGRARLELTRAPAGELRRGAFVVARSVPLGPQRCVLLGRAPVVDRSAAAEFEALLASLSAPRGEFWRVHGAVLARAAWAWPEERECTVDGAVVERSLAGLVVGESNPIVSALDRDSELQRNSDFGWIWRWDEPGGCAAVPELGVRHRLCPEDVGLAELELDLPGGRLWLSALTPARLALAERLLGQRLALGPVFSRHVEAPRTEPRWKRDRMGAAPTAVRRAA